MSEGLIYDKMAKVMKSITGVPKDGWNESQRFAFRSIDTTTEIVHNALVKEGIIILPEVMESTHSTGQTARGGVMRYVSLLVRYTFAASDGSAVSVVAAGEAGDTGDKATSKAMSMALKYCLFQTFLIPTGDPDPVTVEEANPDALTADEKLSLRESLDSAGIASAEITDTLSKALGRDVSGKSPVKRSEIKAVTEYLESIKPFIDEDGESGESQ